MRRLIRRFGVMAATVAGAGALALAPAAFAQGPQEVGVDGGTTLLQLDGSTASALTANGISVGQTGLARPSGQSISFPITSGEVVPNTGADGIFRHLGGLRFSSASGAVTASNFNVATGSPLRAGGNLTARVGSSRIVLGRATARQAVVIRRGPGNVGTWIVRLELRLSAGAATALNRALGTDVFASGLLIGRLDVRSTPADVILTTGTTTLFPAPGLIPALTANGINPNPIQPAAFLDGNVTFPVAGGQWDVIMPPTGTIVHDGALQLANGASVTLSQLTISGNDNEAVLGAIVNDGATVASLFDLNFQRARQGLSNGQLVITGLDATVLQSTATTVNQAFGANLLTQGASFGTMRVQARVL